MAIRLTESRLRQIIREEARRLLEHDDADEFPATAPVPRRPANPPMGMRRRRSVSKDSVGSATNDQLAWAMLRRLQGEIADGYDDGKVLSKLRKAFHVNSHAAINGPTLLELLGEVSAEINGDNAYFDVITPISGHGLSPMRAKVFKMADDIASSQEFLDQMQNLSQEEEAAADW